MKECGVLDIKTARVLTELMTHNLALDFEAYSDLEACSDQDQPLRPIQERDKIFVLPLSINVYGPIESIEKVASLLSDMRVFLQEPSHWPPGTIYHNPHFLSWVDDLETPHLRASDVAAEVYEILRPSDGVKVSDWPRQDDRVQTTLHRFISCGRT